MHSILRHERAGLDFEFLHGIWEWERQVQSVVWIVVHRAVEQIRMPDLPSSNGNSCAALHGAT